MSDTATPVPASPTPAAPRPAGPAAAAADLSRDIEALVDRLPQDRVKCSHVFGPFYRCNWWSLADSDAPGTRRDPVAPWALIASQRIRRSRFLSVTQSAGGRLKITEVGPTAARNDDDVTQPAAPPAAAPPAAD